MHLSDRHESKGAPHFFNVAAKIDGKTREGRGEHVFQRFWEILNRDGKDN